MKRKWKLWMIAFVLFVMTDIMMQSNRAEAKKRTFTVSSKTIPCSSSYRQKPYYNKKTKQYYMINSYMRRLSTTGGTLKLKKGTYKIPGTIYVPSNVKIVCANGVKIKKTKATGTKKVKSTKFLFQMISEEKASGKQNTGKYAASKNASIQGNGKVIFDMGNVNGATAVFVGHASGITVSGVRFRNKKGGSYIWIEGSKNISVRQCVFERKKDVSGLKNRMAVRLETSNQTTSVFSGKWYKKDNTVNKKVKIENNQFLGADVGIGTTKSVVLEKNKQTKEYYQTSITIAANTFTNTKKAPIYAVLWKKPTIKKNVVKRNGAEYPAPLSLLFTKPNRILKSIVKMTASCYTMYNKTKRVICMSTAKQLIIDNLSDISDGIQDEFEVMENLYKLLRFKKSQQSITEYGGHTTDEVRKMFQKKREERTILA